MQQLEDRGSEGHHLELLKQDNLAAVVACLKLIVRFGQPRSITTDGPE